MKNIPYGRQQIDQDDIDAVIETLKSDFLTQGPKIEEFENAFAEYVDSKYAVAVSNATAGLHIANMALDVKQGDRINVNFTLGCSVATPTLNIDGSGAKNIRLGGTNVSISTLTTVAASVIVPMFYDGTYWEIYGSYVNTADTNTLFKAIDSIHCTLFAFLDT